MAYNKPSRGPEAVTKHCRISIPKGQRLYTAMDVTREYGIGYDLAKKLVRNFGRVICRHWMIDEDTFRRILVDEQATAPSVRPE